MCAFAFLCVRNDVQQVLFYRTVFVCVRASGRHSIFDLIRIGLKFSFECGGGL